MQAWLSLARKELRLSRALALGGLAVLIVAGFFGAYLAYRYHSGVELAFAAIAIMAHIWYIPIYMLDSLSKEWRHTAHLWLQLPHSGWSLLGAKLSSGIIWMLASFLITSLFTLWFVTVENLPSHLQLPWAEIWRYGGMAALMIFISGLYMGFWAMLISVSMASAKRLLKKGRWLIGLGVFLIATWGLGAFSHTEIYRFITHWGLLQMTIDPPIGSPAPFHIPLYTGEILYNILVAAAVFYLSGWLLDKKVEV